MEDGEMRHATPSLAGSFQRGRASSLPSFEAVPDDAPPACRRGRSRGRRAAPTGSELGGWGATGAAMATARSWRVMLVRVLGSLLLMASVGSSEALANQALAEALVAVAVHVPLDGLSVFSVQYMISNSDTSGNTVNVKCFDAS